MNYRGFTVPLWEWLSERRIRHPSITEEYVMPTRLSSDALVRAWQAFRSTIPWAVALQQFTLIDSHDTARIRSLVGGSERLHRLAAVLQVTYPGIPCIFYGDEIGLDGANATQARRTMAWREEQWDHDLLAFYQRLIGLRRSSPALVSGGFQVLHTDDDAVVFQRDAVQERLIVVGYRGEQPRAAGLLRVAHGGIADGTRFTEMFSGAQATVAGGCLALPPMQQGAAIWQAGDRS